MWYKRCWWCLIATCSWIQFCFTLKWNQWMWTQNSFRDTCVNTHIYIMQLVNIKLILSHMSIYGEWLATPFLHKKISVGTPVVPIVILVTNKLLTVVILCVCLDWWVFNRTFRDIAPRKRDSKDHMTILKRINEETEDSVEESNYLCSKCSKPAEHVLQCEYCKHWFCCPCQDVNVGCAHSV